MRIFLLFIVLFSVALPVTAIGDDAESLALIHRVKLYGAEHLSLDWEAFHLFSIADIQADIYWTQADYTAVIGISQVIFASSSQEDDYFADMDAYFDIILQNYRPYTLESSCTDDALSLREFTALNREQDYLVKHYIEELEQHEFQFVSLYFPAEYANELAETAALFYPDFVSCPED